MNETLPRTTNGQFVKGIAYSPGTMFRPGQDPANKGKKFPGTGNRESFSKGHQPHNTAFDGATKIRTTNQGRSYEYIRISKGYWEFMQKYRWANEVGEIPEGMILRCKTKDTLNCDPSNWIMISKAENARMNRTECDFKTAICETCGKEYETRSRQSKYCTDECRRLGGLKYMEQWHAKHPKEKKQGPRNVSSKVKICVVCDGAFFPTSNIQKTCSLSCRTILRYQFSTDYRKAHPESVPEKHCSKCGQPFIPSQNSRTICDPCKTKAPRVINCIECGIEFTNSGKGVQLLCSDTCRQEHKMKMRAQYGLKRAAARNHERTCLLCGTQFSAKRGGKYCSEPCKHTAKVACDQKRREKAREFLKQRIPKELKPGTFTCAHCNKQFEAPRKAKFCSDECRTEVKRLHNRSRYKPVKHKIRPELSPELLEGKARPLNKRNPKAEKDAVYAMLELNRNAPKHDREIISQRKIESPNLSEFEYRAYDKRLRITRFFRSEEKYLNYLNEQQS